MITLHITRRPEMRTDLHNDDGTASILSGAIAAGGVAPRGLVLVPPVGLGLSFGPGSGPRPRPLLPSSSIGGSAVTCRCNRARASVRAIGRSTDRCAARCARCINKIWWWIASKRGVTPEGIAGREGFPESGPVFGVSRRRRPIAARWHRRRFTRFSSS